MLFRSTAILFAVPLFIFFTSWIYFKTRMTVWTVVAVVGCLPACKSMVSLIMILLRHPMDEKIYKEICEHAGDLVMSYEMYMTFYEKSGYLDAVAVCGNTVVGYTSDPKADITYLAEQSQKIIRKNGYKVDVKILKDLKPYLERLDSMNEHKESLRNGIKFTPDERYPDLSREELMNALYIVDDQRIWKIAEAVRRGIPYTEIHKITKIDIWFIDKIANLVEMEQSLRACAPRVASGRGGIEKELLKEYQNFEVYLDSPLAIEATKIFTKNMRRGLRQVHDLRMVYGITASYKMVDTCAAEFAAETPYYYSVFGSENEVEETSGKKKVLVLGSGPIRIGQGIEFDFCSVHCTYPFLRTGLGTGTLQRHGVER